MMSTPAITGKAPKKMLDIASEDLIPSLGFEIISDIPLYRLNERKKHGKT